MSSVSTPPPPPPPQKRHLQHPTQNKQKSVIMSLRVDFNCIPAYPPTINVRFNRYFFNYWEAKGWVTGRKTLEPRLLRLSQTTHAPPESRRLQPLPHASEYRRPHATDNRRPSAWSFSPPTTNGLHKKKKTGSQCWCKTQTTMVPKKQYNIYILWSMPTQNSKTSPTRLLFFCPVRELATGRQARKSLRAGGAADTPLLLS